MSASARCIRGSGYSGLADRRHRKDAGPLLETFESREATTQRWRPRSRNLRWNPNAVDWSAYSCVERIARPTSPAARLLELLSLAQAESTRFFQVHIPLAPLPFIRITSFCNSRTEPLGSRISLSPCSVQVSSSVSHPWIFWRHLIYQSLRFSKDSKQTRRRPTSSPPCVTPSCPSSSL